METEKTGVVYRIYHKESMKSYIGRSVNPDNRIREHLAGHSKSPAICNAIKKYGVDAFCVEILEKDMPEAWLSKLEILHIRFWISVSPHGYNLTHGGEGEIPSDEVRQKMSESHKGRPSPMKGKTAWNKGKKSGQPPWNKGKKHTAETRRKISESRKGEKHPNYGKKLSSETRRKMSEANKGRILSQETRQKISDAHRGKKMSSETRRKMSEFRKGKKLSPHQKQKLLEANKGRKHSPETRQKISESLKGKTPSPESRRKMSESQKRRNRSS